MHPVIRLVEKDHQIQIYDTVLPIEGPETSTRSKRDPEMDSKTYNLLRQWLNTKQFHGRISSKFRPLKVYKRFDQSFQPSPSKNSSVMVSIDSKTCLPAVLSSIFLHTRVDELGTKIEDTFAIVQQYLPLLPEDSKKDPYIQFQLAAGHLRYEVPSAECTLVSISQIVGHFAGTLQEIAGIRQPCLHILPLMR